jgi:Leucine-rich repeat (LRR) protein
MEENNTIFTQEGLNDLLGFKDLFLFDRFEDDKIDPNVFKCLNLEALDLADNGLTYIPQEIGNLKKLKWLNLSENYYLRQFPQKLSNLKELNNLLISYCDLEEFPMFIIELNKLQYLNLNGNDLKEIPKEIENLNELVMLGLQWNHLTSLPEELKNLKKLEHLYLWGNNFTVEEKEKIKNLFSSNVEILFQEPS